MSNEYDVIIIGAGAAGMIAAGKLGEYKKSVLLLEKMPQPGRKLRITGKGRCNLTNTLPIDEFLLHTGADSAFLKPAFQHFFNQDLIHFFENKRVPLVIERGNRVFPKSGKAHDIFQALINWIEKQKNIDILKNAKVKRIISSNGFVHGVELENGKRFFAKTVLLATGGKSYPLTGSTGEGYIMAKQLGHTITPVFPCLVSIEVKENVKKLNNLALRNVQISVWDEDKKLTEIFGEMNFTETGISGPIILTLSRQFTNVLNTGKQLTFSIDLKPALSNIKLDNRITRDIEQFGNLKFSDILRKQLPAQLASIAPLLLHINPGTSGRNLSENDRKKLREWMKDFRLTATGTCGYDEAIITKGGISLNEVDANTMQSKLVKGLFFAGEVLDVDADTGGYNLQIAFSTGILAADKISKIV